jgi:hypothetical protein
MRKRKVMPSKIPAIVIAAMIFVGLLVVSGMIAALLWYRSSSKSQWDDPEDESDDESDDKHI